MNEYRKMLTSCARLIACIVVFVSVTCSAQYQWDPALTTGKLDNGLQYVIYNSDKNTDPFNIRLIVNAGSVDENQRAGVAHMLEHMVFHKTQAHPEGIHNYLEKLGWKTGLQVNAMTRQTETQYMIRTRPNDALDMQGSLSLMAQLAGHATLDEADWQRERGVIVEEWRQGNGLAGEVNQLKKAVVRNNSRYVDRPTIGTYKSIKKADISELRDFYNTFYVASNMQLVISGYLDTEKTERAIESAFGTLPSKPKPKRDYVALPLSPKLYIDKVQHPKGSTSMVVYGLRIPMPDRITEQGQYAYLQNYFLRKMMRNQIRRNQTLVESDDIESLSLTVKEPTNNRLIVAIASRTHDHDLGLNVVATELARLYRDGLDEQEFTQMRDKAYEITKRNIEAAKHRDFAAWEDKITEAFIQGSLLESPLTRSERTQQWLDKITFEELNKRMREILDADDNFLYFQAAGDQQITLPTAAEVRQLQADIQTNINMLEKSVLLADVKPKTEQSLNTDSEVTIPELPKVTTKPGSWYPLESEQWQYQQQTLTLKKYQLSNGDQLLWLNKSTPDNKLYIKALTQVGFQNDAMPVWLAQTSIQLWEQSGLPQWSEAEWQQWQQDKPRWQWEFKANELDLAAVIAPEQFANLMQLYHLRMNAGIDNNAWDSVKDAIVEQANRVQPKSQFINQQRFGESMLDGVNQTEVDALSQAKIEEQAKAIINQPVTFYIIGELSQTDLEQQMSQSLANITRKASIDNHTNKQLAAKRVEYIQAHDLQKAEISQYGYLPMQWTPENAFLVSTLTPIAKKMLKKKLRQELGGIYSIKFEMRLDPQHNRVETEVHYTCAPERADELLKATNEVLNDLSSAIAKQDLQRIVDDIYFAEKNRNNNANTWLRRLILSDKRYKNASYIQRSGQLHKQVTLEGLQVLAKQIFPLPHRLTFIDMPGGKKL
ncbi:insulinase family protein [Shewanella electrodiphila]|uniref:Insulinase family protein n=1 Tax=Shewanella electrodiphila TaxID=934143 RepID=A0ABT0KPM5_9GAMM|nr:pitrilysin family protein [Shewanella electrodiphila]MCL1045698.1 insulinase family protein [Shewanella electrodiphila]